MTQSPLPRVRGEIAHAAAEQLDWVSYSARMSAALRTVIPHDRCCWHTVDPGTILFTGSVNHNVGCSGSWLAHYEYEVEDVDKWAFLARSGRLAGALSLDTHGDLSRSARHRSHEAYGIGDELRVSLVTDGIYWGAASFLRDADQPWYTAEHVRAIAALAPALATGLRRSMLHVVEAEATAEYYGPGVVVFDSGGNPQSVSPAAERWIEEIVEVPPPSTPIESKVVQAIAARARAIAPGTDPLELAARSRVRTRSGSWLLLYGTRLSGAEEGCTAVIIQPATPREIAPGHRHGLRTVPTRMPYHRAVHTRAVDQRDGARMSLSALYDSRPPEVDLRQDRGAQPRRTGGADLPRALRATVGVCGIPAIRMVGEGHRLTSPNHREGSTTLGNHPRTPMSTMPQLARSHQKNGTPTSTSTSTSPNFST